MNGLLDCILNDTGDLAPRIISANHNVNDIRIELPDFDADLDRQIRNLEIGPWDAAEYGMSRETAIARVKAAATPEAREQAIAEIRQRAIRRASLDTSNGRVNAAFANKPGWHALGVVVDGLMKSAEAIVAGGMGWLVKKEQLTYTFNGITKAADSWGIIRQDTGAYLGTVGSRYEPIQNVQGFEFLDGVIGEYGARYESVGSIYGGKSVWMLAHMPAQRFTVNGDAIEPYVLFTNCHDGSGAAYVYPTTVRVECANTFRTSIGDRGKGLSIRHTGNVTAKIVAAREALGLAVNGFSQFKEAAQTLVAKKAEIVPYATGVLDAIFEETEAKLQERMGGIEDELADAAWERHQDKRREMLAEIMERYEAGRCHPAGTAWAAFNAVTEFADHNEQGRQRGDTTTRLSRRFESILSGERDDLKQVAFTKALAL
jgi:phage/plasmid-like protein (TIGR03299 family)